MTLVLENLSLFLIIKDQSLKNLFELIPTTRQANMANIKAVFLFLILDMTILKVISSF